MPPPPEPYSKEEARAVLLAQLAATRELTAAIREHTAALAEITAALDQNLTAFSAVARAQAVEGASGGVLELLQGALGGGAPKRRRGR